MYYSTAALCAMYIAENVASYYLLAGMLLMLNYCRSFPITDCTVHLCCACPNSRMKSQKVYIWVQWQIWLLMPCCG